jgi:hypothetical protein
MASAAKRALSPHPSPKLPKMLRRKDLFDTVSNGCEQGLYVLSLPRPDGSARTWWRAQVDESALGAVMEVTKWLKRSV